MQPKPGNPSDPHYTLFASMGQPKILISSHFVHTETQTDMQTKMDALQRPRLLISSTGDCPMLVKMRVQLPLFPHIHIYLLADREGENDRERCSDAEGLMVSLQSRMPPSSPDSLSAPLSLNCRSSHFWKPGGTKME